MKKVDIVISLLIIDLLLFLTLLGLKNYNKNSKTEESISNSIISQIPIVTFNKDNDVKVQLPSLNSKTVKQVDKQKVFDRVGKIEALRNCKTLLGEYKSRTKLENKKIIKDIPDYVPSFGEANVVEPFYPYKKTNWKKTRRQNKTFKSLLARLKFYPLIINPSFYNSDPDKKPNFTEQDLGILNDSKYCSIHDMLLLNQSDLLLSKPLIVTDYHQLSLLRMFIFSKKGEDLMPKISKNMLRLNFEQPLYHIDPRANLFFFKKADFHYRHQLGKHFGCFGQSYNHIPGHGVLGRKDLFSQFSLEWGKKLVLNPKINPFLQETIFYVFLENHSSLKMLIIFTQTLTNFPQNT